MGNLNGKSESSNYENGNLTNGKYSNGKIMDGNHKNGKLATDTQKDFDIYRYLGNWNEIAKYKFKWEESCNFASAEYSWDPIRGVMIVKNNCLDAVHRKIYSRSGVARIPNINDTSKLRIKFNDGLPADPEGDYYVFYTDYDNYSIVGTPSKDLLWILSRKKKIPVKDVPMLLKKVSSFGFDPEKLISNPALLTK